MNEFLASEESDTIGKANLTYKFSRDSMVYASWGQGFRLGRPDVGLPASCDANNDGNCNVSDIVAVNIEIFSPGSTSTCARQPVAQP